MVSDHEVVGSSPTGSIAALLRETVAVCLPWQDTLGGRSSAVERVKRFIKLCCDVGVFCSSAAYDAAGLDSYLPYEALMQ